MLVFKIMQEGTYSFGIWMILVINAIVNDFNFGLNWVCTSLLITRENLIGVPVRLFFFERKLLYRYGYFTGTSIFWNFVENSQASKTLKIHIFSNFNAQKHVLGILRGRSDVREANNGNYECLKIDKILLRHWYKRFC